jgi:hypothetical protein
MADKFIEWDRDRLVVAQGTRDGAKAQFRLVKILERSSDSNDTLSVVDQLKQIFPIGSDRKRASVALVFPRQLVTIHRIQLPQVPDSEIPDMIRLQASMRLTVPIESVCMDFTPLPVQTGSSTRDVLLVTVPSDQVAIARRTLNDAGLDLSEVRVSAYCVAQVADRAGLLTESADLSRVAVIALMRRDFIELTFVRGTSVVFSHSGNSWTSTDSIERTLRAELTRARMSAAEILGELKIDRVILIGSPDVTAAVTDQISTRLDGAKIERIDPAAAFLSGVLPEGVSSAEVVTLAGAMVGDDRTSVEAVDLINPRKAPEKKDLRRIRILLSSLAGLLIFAGAYYWRQGRIADLTAEKSVVDTENAEISESLRLGEKDLAQATKVGAWVDRDISWLDEFVRLRELLPATDRMFIRNVQMQVIQQNGIGSIRLEGYAKSDADINNLARRLRDAGYGVKPYEPEYRASAVSQDYGVRIVLEVSLPVASDDSENNS